jgi:hypothetical protein
MSYTLAQLETKLQTIVRDTTESIWSSGEFTEVLTEAIEDPALSIYAEDSTLTALASTQDYVIPSTVDKVEDVYIASGTVKCRVNPELWEQVNTTLRFVPLPPSTGTITLVGLKKSASGDTLPNEFGNFVLYSAAMKLYEILLHQFATRFLKNDLTLAEISSSIDRFERKADRERSRLGRVTGRKGYKV